MKAYLQVPSDVIPLIRLDPENNIFEISGRSIPVHADKVYGEVIHWLDDFSKESPKAIKIVIKLEFFNIASSKRLLVILYKLRSMKLAGTRVTVQWVYDKGDRDMLEIGNDYAGLVDELEFQFLPLSTKNFLEDQSLKCG